MDSRKMKELNLDEMDKVCGGAGNDTSCTPQNWGNPMCGNDYTLGTNSKCGELKTVLDMNSNYILIPDPDTNP